MKTLIKILPVLFIFSTLAAQEDTMYLRYQSDIVEKLLVGKVDSFLINDGGDSLLIYQRDVAFGQEVQFLNKKPLAEIDSIYFYHSLTSIVEVGVFKSYILNGHDEVLAFDPGAGMDSVLNLTITGADVTTSDLHTVAYKISKVKGVFTMDGTAVQGWPINFFAQVSLDSSIIIRNSLPAWNNINAFEFAVVGVVNGDLILENNPGFDFCWGDELPVGERTAGFMGVTGVKGDLILRDCPRLGANFAGLENVAFVGGDLVVDNAADGSTGRTLYNFSKCSLETIGGGLTITNCNALNSLSGLENITFIGGDVSITNNGSLGEGIPLSISAQGEIGFCWVKDAMDAGIIGSEAIITLSDSEGNAIDPGTLTGCAD